MTAGSGERRIVVTGAASEIGRDIATRMAADGHRVLINDLDPVALHELAHQIGAIAAPGDADLVDIAVEWLGGVDVWIGTSGSAAGQGLETSDDAWSDMWADAVMAHVRAARDLAPRWAADGSNGLLVVVPPAGDLPAEVAAGAVGAFTRWLDDAHRDSGVSAHTIRPIGGRSVADDVAALVTKR
ncbi:SDR family oxidoreductase [Gordonia sp. (in: high G+C Gram-positive bacteria)]|uniref:SDR family oxidoreductase n=1 Tax=Gordonia sp. (in: high G+C Gram-positive bacteria) TaxID=84139 RepID=UPI00333E9AF9